MKTDLKLLALCLILLISINSCKKSENDPFFTILPRISRITGEWKLTEGNIYYETYLNDTLFAKYTEKYDGTYLIKNDLLNNVIDTSLNISTYTIKANKTFESELIFSSPLYDYQYGKKFTEIYSLNEGDWYFEKSDENYNNKERITFSSNYNTLFFPNDTTETYYNSPAMFTFIIDKITNNELVLRYENNTFISNGLDSVSGYVTYIKQ